MNPPEEKKTRELLDPSKAGCKPIWASSDSLPFNPLAFIAGDRHVELDPLPQENRAPGSNRIIAMA